MAIYTLYNYHCWPIRPDIPKDKDSELFVDSLMEMDRKVMENMKRHQEIIDIIFTTDIEKHFMVQKPKKGGGFDKCLAFQYKGKCYYFKVLIPKEGCMGGSRYLIRIANPKKSTREIDFKRTLQPDEPSATVIIDNAKDQQRILIEHTRAWNDTDMVRNLLQGALGALLAKEYQIGIVIDVVWQKNTFRNILKTLGDYIKSIEFDVGYPNMGRTGEVFLKPLKDSLSNTYASGTVKYSLPKLPRKKTKGTDGLLCEPRKTLALDYEDIDPLMDEISEHCRAIGSTTKFGLITGHQVKLTVVPENQLKNMSPERREMYEKVGEVFSTYTVNMSEKVSNFDGQDDLFHGVEEIVLQKLQELKEAGA